MLDVFVTLLGLGVSGYKRLLQQRAEMFDYLKAKLGEVAEAHGERVLATKRNTISLGMTLSNLATMSSDPADLKFLGAMLFTRCVSGTRVVISGEKKTVAGQDFVGYGSHTDAYHTPYLTAAAAIGMERQEVDVFIERLSKGMKDYKKKMAKAMKPVEHVPKAPDVQAVPTSQASEEATPPRAELV